MAIALITQDVNASATPAGTSATITVTSSIAGSLLVLTIHLQSSAATVVSVTDNLGSTWVRAVDLSTTGSYTGIWYLPTAPAGITSVIATESAGTAYSASVSQWSGAATVSPVRAVNTAAVTTSPNRTGVVATSSGDLVVGGVSSNSATARTLSAPFTGLTRGTLPAGFTAEQAYYLTPGGSDEAQWTTASAANTGGVIAAFIPAVPQVPGSAALAAAGSLTASASVTVPGTAALAAAGTLTAVAGRVTHRPNTGATARPAAGSTTRPTTGTTLRPTTTTTVRPNTGITARP